MRHEHYTKATTETTEFCRKCRRITRHAVSGGRLAHCLEHTVQMLTKSQAKRRERIAADQKQPRFF
jgi:ribosomal protein L44E